MVLAEFLTVVIVHFLALISPGPDFFLITRNSLIYSRRTGIYSSLGIAMGLATHITYSLIGITSIISQSEMIFSLMKFLAAGYMIYLGYKSLTGKSHNKSYAAKKQRDPTKFEAFKMGFVTNITNPKAALFFLSLFTLVISVSTPTWIKIIYGIVMTSTTFLWFAFLATILSHQIIKSRISKFQNYVEKIMGIILILVGMAFAFSAR